MVPHALARREPTVMLPHAPTRVRRRAPEGERRIVAHGNFHRSHFFQGASQTFITRWAFPHSTKLLPLSLFAITWSVQRLANLKGSLCDRAPPDIKGGEASGVHRRGVSHEGHRANRRKLRSRRWAERYSGAGSAARVASHSWHLHQPCEGRRFRAAASFRASRLVRGGIAPRGKMCPGRPQSRLPTASSLDQPAAR